MKDIRVAYQVERKLHAPLSDVGLYLRNIENIARCTPGVVEFTRINKNTARWQLETIRDMGIVFSPHYTLVYDFDTENSLGWHSIDGNVSIRARLTMIPLTATETLVKVEEEVVFQLPISHIMAKLVSTIATKMSRNDMDKTLRNIEDNLIETIDSN